MSKPHNTALHVYIHTHRLYIHTYILTDKYIHTPIHACTYRHAPPTHRGAGHTIHTHIHTYIQIHTYIHTCMYIQTRPPNPQGGGGRPLVPPTYKNLCTQTLWGGVGGGACSPGPYIVLSHYLLILYLWCKPCISHSRAAHARPGPRHCPRRLLTRMRLGCGRSGLRAMAGGQQ